MTESFQPSTNASVWKQLKAIMDRSPADAANVRRRFSEQQLKRFEEDEWSSEAVHSLTHPKTHAKCVELGIDIDRTWVRWAKECYDTGTDWIPDVQTRKQALEALRWYHETHGTELLRIFVDDCDVNHFVYMAAKNRFPSPEFLVRIVDFLCREARYGAPMRQMSREQVFYWIVKRDVFGDRDLLPTVTEHETFVLWVEGWYRPKSRAALAEICGVGVNAFRSWITRRVKPTREKLTSVLKGILEKMPDSLEFKPGDPEAPPMEIWARESAPAQELVDTVEPDAHAPEDLRVVPEAATALEEQSTNAPELASTPQLSKSIQNRLLASSDLLAEQADADADIVKHLAAATKALRARRDRSDALLQFVRNNEEERERELALADERVSRAEETAAAAQEAAAAATARVAEATQQLEELQRRLEELEKRPASKTSNKKKSSTESGPKTEPKPMDDLIAGRIEPGERRGNLRFIFTAENWREITGEFTTEEVKDTSDLIVELARRLAILNQMDPDLRAIVVEELRDALRMLYMQVNNRDAEHTSAIVNDIALSLEVYAERDQG